MYKILICDDDRDIAAALKIYLEAEGYETVTAHDGAQALELAAREDPQLVLLDIMMPGMDGITAMAKLRETSNVPVILLTAKSEDADKVLGLNLGADDYITKPFKPVELLARVRSQLRRYLQLGGGEERRDLLRCGALELDDRSKSLTVSGESVALTPTEFEILKLLMQHPGEVFSPAALYRKVWNDEPYGAESTVAVHIRHLREKIEIDPAQPRYIKAIWGQGYKLEKDKM